MFLKNIFLPTFRWDILNQSEDFFFQDEKWSIHDYIGFSNHKHDTEIKLIRAIWGTQIYS